MSTLSLRLPDNLMEEVDSYARELHIPRAAYVRKAIEQMNASVAAQRRRDWLMEISRKVRIESMVVNSDFSEVEHDPDF